MSRIEQWREGAVGGRESHILDLVAGLTTKPCSACGEPGHRWNACPEVVRERDAEDEAERVAKVRAAIQPNGEG